MTAPAAPRAVGAPARFFLAAVLALGVAFGFATTASATTSAAAENAVGASTVALASFVGLSGDVSPATHLESYDSQAKIVSATGVAANSGLTSDLEALATRNVTNSGQTVLGSHPTYIEAAQARGASYFDIGDAWNGLSPAQRTAANNFFLDSRMAAGDQFYMTTPKGLINPSSQLAEEVAYITRPGSGYQWVNQWSLKSGG